MCSAYSGYVVGLGPTIVVMNIFEAAQPALLYIVPAVLAAVLGHAALNKEFLEVRPPCSKCASCRSVVTPLLTTGALPLRDCKHFY